MGAPVLITGPAGCGKTSLIEEVSRMVGQKDLLKIHLGDQTDSKILLGTYVCQSEPGSFKWQPGILTTAVMNGRWVLIEDLDLAPMEVISVLIPLLETGHLFIPSRGEKVRAKEGFQLFATQTVAASSSRWGAFAKAGGNEMGASLWNKIAVEPLPSDEMCLVIETLYPSLGAVVSFRDVVKWCRRLERLHIEVLEATASDGTKLMSGAVHSIDEVSLQAKEALFREADRKMRNKAMAIVADILAVPGARLEFYTEHYLPVLASSDNAASVSQGKGRKVKQKISVGRVSLSFTPTTTAAFATGSTFANTSLSLRLLEKLAVCVSMQESVLLTGETGTGKTTIIQQLANMCGKSLTVINMSQQSDSTDLLGGFKPIEATMIAMPMLERFEMLFSRTFSSTSNAAFLESVRGAYIKRKWDDGSEPVAKKSKKLLNDPNLIADWEEFSTLVKSFSAQLDHLKNSFLFSFVEGTLVKAITRGEWILLDEVNLASPETLESLSGILQSPTGSLLLLERGDTEPVKRHPDFRLFACMNPANDAGKRDLPPGLLSRFTEMWVDSPDTIPQDLALIIRRHLYSCLPHPTQGGNAIVADIAEFHTAVKNASESGFLVDGSSHKVNINLRTLTRALGFASSCASTYGLRRSLYEGCQMTYATILGKDSLEVISKLFEKHLMNGIKNMGSFLKSIPKMPGMVENGGSNSDAHILFGSYWIKKGPLEANEAPKYVLTKSVETNLNRLARAVMSSKYPVLIQGPTSAGKTSMVEYLATRTGHRFIRVNNHEHTDLQEYIGTYVSNAEGKLVFREVYVLESLNRLLDDNRELLIPETQETVRPHPGFMLFATQNPPGLYGGRKQLSRAFRSRFIELHFDDIPEPELSVILERRCRLPPSYSAKIVSTYKGLQNARQRSRIFEGKHAFATLRDLFRWGNRPADSAEELAENGFMVLAEKSRRDDEKEVVRDVLEQTFRLKLDPVVLYDREWTAFMSGIDVTNAFVKNIVWTNAMKRLFVLVLKSIKNLEPILLVGETGCGKTTVCQILTNLMGINLQIVNAHAGSETSDFIGSMRPSKKLFEWSDGPLVQAMRVGEAFLLDEISLADDSVLERLNSVLESERLLVLAERGAVSSDDTDGHDPTHSHIEEIRGHTNFSFMATMNPGGDYGKKELSPALRNRFTELWVPSIGDKTDLQMIINQRLNALTFRAELIHQITDLLLDFLDWFAAKLNMARTSIVSLRDIMAWVAFITTMMKTEDTVGEDSLLLLCKSAFHGGCMVLLDGIGVNPLFGAMLGSSAAAAFRRECSHHYFLEKVEIVSTDDQFGIPPFLVRCGPEPRKEVKFALKAPTTSINALRVLRALRLSKPVLLEGSPGVGKSSLISALSATAGYSLCRINLSEQTDLMDLFGSDLPVEGGKGGEFAWRDGPFLSAMKTGQWVLLDELNLATQQVLEGLNACLDHRATVYIPELNRSFDCHANFRVFAAQNPQNQGGGRKGLPKSFVNRFTQVYIEALTSEDMLFIVANLHPEVDEDIVRRMIQFNQAMHEETMVKHSFGSRGSPWEFNLRDILRWIELLKSDGNASIDYLSNPHQFLKMMYCQRMRTKSDEAAVLQLFNTFFADQVPKDCGFEISSSHVKVGSSLLMRTGRRQPHNRGYVTGDRLEILSSQLSVLESLIKCVEMSWMAILSGSTSSGKTSMVRLLAKLAGQQLDEFSMNSGIDAVELLGGFEQVDLTRREQSIIRDLEHTVDCILRYYTLRQDTEFESSNAFHLLSAIRKLGQTTDMMMETVLGLICDMDGSFNASGSGLKDYVIQAGAKLPIDIRAAFEELQSLISSGVHGQFEWIDGTLIKALEEGRWILIDNANMCPASVLDRLNHLLEPNGVLIINERGLVNGEIKVIKPHPNFRMFMTVDPQVGEISRAMRNRGVELFLHSKLLLNSYGLPGVDIPKRLRNISSDFGRHIRGLHIPFDDSPSMLVKFAKIAVERVERGFYWHESAIEAWNETYFDTASLSSLPETSSATLLASFSELTAYTEVATARFPVRPFPSSWPFRVSGTLCIQESMLSHVAMESSFLAFLSSLEGEIVHIESSGTLPESDLKLLLPLPKNISLLRSAIFSFVEKDSIVPSIKNMVLAYVARRYSAMQSSFALETGLKLIDSKISVHSFSTSYICSLTNT
ncbi:P-loop containing nucleoside triphosphate hydrolase protein [Chytriomyces cf. hyalinus JEL632]|nr:P-loop containing nucleoside triphosphate hydrolase protein [Chytriomyces cf. hyalinus JEL632]